MPEQNLISSLHDDFLYPYDAFFERTGNTITLLDFAQKLEQLGINRDDLTALGIEKLDDISDKQYTELVKQAMTHGYDVAFPSIFAWWSTMKQADQMAYIKHAAGWYKKLDFTMVEKGSQLTGSGPYLVLSLEGADCVTSLKDMQELYDLGIRSMMLQYFEPNALISEHGLTKLGKECVHFLLQHNVIVDLAHQSPAARADIFVIAEELGMGGLLAYTHGSMTPDIEWCNECHPSRGLTTPELKKLIEMGGIVGLGVTKPFFKSLNDVIIRFNHVVHLGEGAHHVALGTDFGGVDIEDQLGINCPSDVAHLMEMLHKRCYLPESVLHDISRNNVRHWLAKPI